MNQRPLPYKFTKLPTSHCVQFGRALFSDGYIRYIRFFRYIYPARSGLYAMREKELPNQGAGGTEIYKLKKSPLSPFTKGGFYNTTSCIVLSL